MAKNRAPQLVQARIVNGEIRLYLDLNSINIALKAVTGKAIDKDKDTLTFRLSDGNTTIGEETQIVPIYNSSTGNDLDYFIRLSSDGFDNLPFGRYTGRVTVNTKIDLKGTSKDIELPIFDLPVSQSLIEPQAISLKPAFVEPTADKSFWEEINEADLNFKHYKRFIDAVLCTETSAIDKGVTVDKVDRIAFKNRLPFLNVDEYSLVKFATDRYLQTMLRIGSATGYFGGGTRLPYFESISDDIDDILKDYSQPTPSSSFRSASGSTPPATDCIDRRAERIEEVPLLELIWSFWMDQAYLDQTMGVISLRFQNIRGPREIEPLARFDTSSLRPLSSLLWGYIQDEQHRTTLRRRTFEYKHAYNLTLIGKAVPRQQGVDNRSNFLAAFHHLLHQASIFFRDYDDMTRRADGFPLLTALREVHLLLAEGNHNAYYNMTWTSRAEMMVQQYLLARDETQRFLGGRPMVPYPQEWMDRVDTMKGMQGWDSTSVLHYFDLANSGEKLLLGVRYGDWANTAFSAADATNWAIAFRDHAMRYINAYRTVTGVDLSADAFRNDPAQRAAQPAALILRRLQAAQQQMATPQRQPQRVAIRRY